MTVSRDELLRVLDETPRTITGLSRRLGADEDEVEAALEEIEAEGLAVDWGELWATTWRAKLELEPAFFRLWIPVSIALGASLTAFAVGMNAPAATPAWVMVLLIGIAATGVVVAAAPLAPG